MLVGSEGHVGMGGGFEGLVWGAVEEEVEWRMCYVGVEELCNWDGPEEGEEEGEEEGGGVLW